MRLRSKAGLGQICEAFAYSRQAYYKHRLVEGKRHEKQKEVLIETRKIRSRQPKSGTRKIQRMLLERGVCIGRDRLFELLRDEGLLIARRRNRRRTTYSGHGFRVYRNLIKDLEVKRPEEVFVSDITYIETQDKYCYLSLLTDLYSRKIVGYELSQSLAMEGTLRALKRALRGVKNPKKLIHHSDRGIQYCSKVYANYLKTRGVRISMTEKDHVYENALAERVNGILKNELMLGERLPSFEMARKMVKEAVEIYNNERLHMSIGYVTPQQKHAA